MLDAFRDTSTLPPRGVSEKRAVAISHALKALSALAMLAAFIAFFALPSTRVTTTSISTTPIVEGASCQMISRVTKTMDISTYSFSQPLPSATRSLSSLFVQWGTPGATFNGGSGVPTNSASSILCQPQVTTTASPNWRVEYATLYTTHAVCLRDTAAVACTVSDLSPNNGAGRAFAANCLIGKEGIVLHFDWTVGVSGNNYVTSWTPPGPLCVPNPPLPTNAELSAAVAAALPPSYFCSPFIDNANPPYLCTGSERAPILSIISQSLSLYTTTLGVLVAFSSFVLNRMAPKKAEESSAAAAAGGDVYYARGPAQLSVRAAGTVEASVAV